MTKDYHIVILVSKDCNACKTIEEQLKDKIAKGEVDVLDVETELGQQLAEKLDVKAFPTFLYIEKTKEGLLVCNPESNKCVEMTKK